MCKYIKILVLMVSISLSGVGIGESTMIKGKFQKKFGEDWTIYVSEDARYKIVQIDDYSMDDHGINHFAVKNNFEIYKRNKPMSISIKSSRGGAEGFYIDGVKYEDSILDAEMKLNLNGDSSHNHVGVNKELNKDKIVSLKQDIEKPVKGKVVVPEGEVVVVEPKATVVEPKVVVVEPKVVVVEPKVVVVEPKVVVVEPKVVVVEPKATVVEPKVVVVEPKVVVVEPKATVVEPKVVVDIIGNNKAVEGENHKIKTIKEIVYLIDKNITDKLITIETELKAYIKEDKHGINEVSAQSRMLIEKINSIKETIKKINLNLINSEKQRKILEVKIKQVGAEIGDELDNKIKGLSNGLNGVLETDKAINKYLIEMNSVILSLMQEQRFNLKSHATKNEAGIINLATDLKAMVADIKDSDAIRTGQTKFMVVKIDETIKRLDELGAFAEGADIAKQVSINIGKSYIEIKQILADIEGRMTRSIKLVGYENKAIRKDLGFIEKGIMARLAEVGNKARDNTSLIIEKLKIMHRDKKQNDSAISIKMATMANNNALINKIVTGNGGVIRNNKKSIEENQTVILGRFNQINFNNDEINKIVAKNGIVIRNNKTTREKDNNLMIKDMAAKEKNILDKVADSKELAIDNQFKMRDVIERLEKKVDLQNKMINDIKAENDFFKNYDRKPDNAIRILIRSLFSIKEADGITILDSFDKIKGERVIDIHIGKMILKNEDVNGLNKVLNHKLRFVFGEDGIKRVGGILGTNSIRFLLNKWYFEEYKKLKFGEDVDGFEEKSREMLATFRIPGEVNNKSINKANKKRKLYAKYCYGCHESGFAGAVSRTDKEHWSHYKSITKKVDMLKIVKNGIGLMPRMGMCYNCDDNQLEMAIEWLIGEKKQNRRISKSVFNK